MSGVRASRERLTKWRALFAGWQLGTRPLGDPESDAVRNHREVTILLQAEVSALVALLEKKGILTAEEFTEAIGAEAEQLNKDYERRFLGVQATDSGLTIDQRAIEWMKKWRP
jgi:hypothetical protein